MNSPARYYPISPEDEQALRREAAEDQRPQLVADYLTTMSAADFLDLLANGQDNDTVAEQLQRIFRELRNPLTDISRDAITTACVILQGVMLGECDANYGDRLVRECAEEA